MPADWGRRLAAWDSNGDLLVTGVTQRKWVSDSRCEKISLKKIDDVNPGCPPPPPAFLFFSPSYRRRRNLEKGVSVADGGWARGVLEIGRSSPSILHPWYCLLHPAKSQNPSRSPEWESPLGIEGWGSKMGVDRRDGKWRRVNGCDEPKRGIGRLMGEKDEAIGWGFWWERRERRLREEGELGFKKKNPNSTLKPRKLAFPKKGLLFRFF